MDTPLHPSEPHLEVSALDSLPIEAHGQFQSLDSMFEDQHSLFRSIYTYPWKEDSEFQSGLSSILAHFQWGSFEGGDRPGTDLLLQAQCFYFARKHNLPAPVEIAAYNAWLNTHCQDGAHIEAASTSLSEQTSTNSISPAQSVPPIPNNPPEPPFPSTFAAIVDLITRNQPIPGIEEVPATVLDASLSQPDKTPRRQKPWETQRTSKGNGQWQADEAPSWDMTSAKSNGIEGVEIGTRMDPDPGETTTP